MTHLSIEEPKFEKFFNNSKGEIDDFSQINHSSELSEDQKKELASRISSFHENRSIGRNWDHIKTEIATDLQYRRVGF